MTSIELEKSDNVALLSVYKKKARCFHSRGQAYSILNELERRLENTELQKLYISFKHVITESNISEHNKICDILIDKYSVK